MKITLVEDPATPTSPTLNPVSVSPTQDDDASEQSGSPFEGLTKLSTIGSTDQLLLLSQLAQDEAASAIQSIFRGHKARASIPSELPSSLALKDVAQEVAVATIQSLVRGASVRSKNVLPRKPTLTPGAVDVIGDMVDGAITTALSPRGAAPRDDKQEDRRPTLQAETTTYISALCGGAISDALTKSPGTLKRGLGETEVMDIMGEARRRATTIIKGENAMDMSKLKRGQVEEESSSEEGEEEGQEKFSQKAQSIIEDTVNNVIKNALLSPVNSPVNQKRSTMIRAKRDEDLALDVMGEARRRATTIMKGEDAVDLSKLKRQVVEESSSDEEEEEEGARSPVRSQSFLDRMGGADNRVYDVDYYLDNGEDVDNVDHQYVTKYETTEEEEKKDAVEAPELLPPPSPKREKEKLVEVADPVPPTPTEIPPEPEVPSQEKVVEVVPPEAESRPLKSLPITIPVPAPASPPALKVEMDIPKPSSEPTALKVSSSPAKQQAKAAQAAPPPPMTPIAFPVHTTPQTPLDQIVIIAHKQAFEKSKQTPTSLQCTEIVRILQALSLVKGRSLDSLLATCGLRTVAGKNDRFNVPIGGSLKDLKKALVKAWSDLEEGGGNSKNKSFTPELLKQTKKHLTDLLRLPKPALVFLQNNFNPEAYTTEQVSKFFGLLGLKEQQFHQANSLHKTGDTINEITAKAVNEKSQAAVLRSSLLRRRILLGVEVIKIILQWKRAKAFESRGGEAEVMASPRTGNPFSGIVEDLRRSVGELQMTLHNKEHTITRLNDKVSRLEKKAADAGISLMSPEATTQQPTTPSRRPLYRDEGAVTVGFLGSSGGDMVAVSKEMWEDPRVLSPAKGGNTSPVMKGAIEPKKPAHPLSNSFEKRQQLKTATAIFSPNSMTVTSFPQKNPPSRFNEEDPSTMPPPKPPSPTHGLRATTAPGGPRGRPFARDVDIILGAPNGESTRGIGGTMTGLIRKGSPTKRSRPVSATGVNRPKPPVQLAVGTSAKAKAILTDIWVDFQAGASPKREKKKKRRGRKISSTAGRTIGGVGLATKILDGFNSDSSDDEEDDNVMFGRGEDNLDNIVSGSYCEHDASNDENIRPPDSKPLSSPNSPVRINKTKKKKKDRSMSPTQRRLDSINSDVTKAKNRLDKQLKLLRGHAFESDPKSAQEIVSDVRKKEKARLAADGGKKKMRRPKSPLKGMWDNPIVDADVGEGGRSLRVDGSEI
ncbi:hypothetical protein TrST_g5930 [Triparma strigata]|uniref:Uncharacterized protein n=1 Tax=Triparma strigata TaxID=1606541 RepID=A0A9W7AQH0_9STRA|nr:hypothetical protein TrST_g5930 [Triparma strigata]